MEKQQSRRRVKQLQVPVLPSEASEIKANAATCGLSVAAYLRTLGLHYEPKTTLDADAVIELARINGDLGRLGGLLKMLLTNTERVKGSDPTGSTLHSMLAEIRATQELLFETAKKL